MVNGMDYGKLVGDAFAYAKDGLFGNAGTWAMLLILTIIPAIPIIGGVIAMIFMLAAVPDIMVLAIGFGIAILLAMILSAFYGGYTLKILRGETPLPPVTGFSTLFADGIRMMVIQFIYMIPALIVFCVTVLPVMLSLWTTVLSGQEPAGVFQVLVSLLGGVLLTIIVGFVTGLFSMIGVVRYARTGSIGEAFNFPAILRTIRGIGWGTYIAALLVVFVIVIVISFIVGMIPILGGIIQFVINPFIGVFTMRYICLLYDSAGTA